MKRRDRNKQKRKDSLWRRHRFARFCEDFGIRNLCDCPDGIHGPDWNYWSMDNVDEAIRLNSLRHDGEMPVYCTERAEGSVPFGRSGHPVLSTAEEGVLTLVAVHYIGRTMYVSLVSAVGELIMMPIAILRRLNPKMVGLGPCGKGASPQEMARGYYLLRNRRRINRR